MSRGANRPGFPAVDPATAVSARPVVIARWAVIGAVFVLVVFIGIALVMTTSESAGAPFTSADQIATAVVGVAAAAGILLLTRPRLVADRAGLRAKAWAGDYRFIPWELVVDVRFPPSARFARVVLPGEEYLSLYAVHRWDGERAVATMDRLRALQAAVRAPGPAGPRRDESGSESGSPSGSERVSPSVSQRDRSPGPSPGASG